MDDSISIDLSDDQHADEYAEIVMTVADMLLDFADVSKMTAEEQQQTQAAMEEVAVAILGELDLSVIGRNGDGTVTATLRPKGIDL